MDKRQIREALIVLGAALVAALLVLAFGLASGAVIHTSFLP